MLFEVSSSLCEHLPGAVFVADVALVLLFYFDVSTALWGSFVFCLLTVCFSLPLAFVFLFLSVFLVLLLFGLCPFYIIFGISKKKH